MFPGADLGNRAAERDLLLSLSRQCVSVTALHPVTEAAATFVLE